MKCSRCGRKFRATEPRVYSRFTGSRYCTDLNACAARARRRKARSPQEEAAQ